MSQNLLFTSSQANYQTVARQFQSDFSYYSKKTTKIAIPNSQIAFEFKIITSNLQVTKLLKYLAYRGFFKIQQHTTLLPLISSVSQSITYRCSKVYLMMMVSTIQSYALTHILTMGNQPLFCHYIDL